MHVMVGAGSSPQRHRHRAAHALLVGAGGIIIPHSGSGRVVKKQGDYPGVKFGIIAKNSIFRAAI
jgi:hypothetical protein